MRKVQALKNVSFVSYAGESIGILGKNGSGKSTLLNIIAGNERQSAGLVRVAAQPTLLGVSAALQNHLTGRMNVKLGLLAMGVQPSSVTAMINPVLEWAELGEAADRPMAGYSSGMRARLKFAIATAVRREILLVDEALSTGDSTFAQKANARMKDFLNEAGTVFIVSHAPGSIEQSCNRVLWIHSGEIIADGDPGPIGKSYRKWSRLVADQKPEEAQSIIEARKEAYRPPRILFDSEAAEILDKNRHETRLK